MTVLLVRHAEAGSRSTWAGPDEDRPLSAEGERQAERLVDVLAEFTVDRILSSPYTRCMQTVARLGLPVEPSDDLAEGAGPAGLALVRSLLVGPVVVLCTHGDVVEEVLDALAVDRRRETPKGATWVFDRGTARYLPPPA